MSHIKLLAIILLPLFMALAGCNGGGSSLPGNITDPTDQAPTTPPAGGNDGVEQPEETTPGDDEDGNSDDDGNTSPDGGGDTGEKQSPHIVSTAPANHSESVSTTASIFVTFDEAIDPASVSAAAVTLIGPALAPVPLEISTDNEKLILTPKKKLDAGGAYLVTVNPVITDLDGNVLAESHSWQFVTAKGLCADFYAAGFNLVEGKDATRPAGGLSKPPKGVPYADPVYNTCVVRVTDHESEGLHRQARNLYSRIQPFNADDSRLLVHALDGSFHLYDPYTTEYIRGLDLGGGSVEPQWHPTNPDILFVLPNHGGMTISKVNVVTGEREVVTDFRHVAAVNGYPNADSLLDIWPNAARVWTHWEGSPSADARYWAFMVETSDGSPLGMISYDLENNVITGTYDYDRDGGGVGAPDHISISPSGKYVVPAWGKPNDCPGLDNLGTRNNPCGLMSFTRDFSSAVGLTTRGPHSDIGIDANGRDVIVAGDYASGWVEMWDLATGEKTHLFEIYENGNSTAMHISAKNFDKPGWALISTYMEQEPGWYVRKLMAVEMKANPRILNIAHTYNEVNDYYSETHASVNRDFTRIVFNSNWNSGNVEDIDVYMVVLPENAVPYP